MVNGGDRCHLLASGIGDSCGKEVANRVARQCEAAKLAVSAIACNRPDCTAQCQTDGFRAVDCARPGVGARSDIGEPVPDNGPMPASAPPGAGKRPTKLRVRGVIHGPGDGHDFAVPQHSS